MANKTKCPVCNAKPPRAPSIIITPKRSLHYASGVVIPAGESREVCNPCSKLVHIVLAAGEKPPTLRSRH